MLSLPHRSRKRRVVSQFEDLQACYLKLRKQGPNIPETNESMGNGHRPGGSDCFCTPPTPHLAL